MEVAPSPSPPGPRTPWKVSSPVAATLALFPSLDPIPEHLCLWPDLVKGEKEKLLPSAYAFRFGRPYSTHTV